MTTKQNSSKQFKQNGFALISTILVMSMLMFLALAMLSISSVETRQSGANTALSQAQANARMALMIAIGELQKNAGPDQRVSARADIKPGVDPSRKYWTGFWSTEGWDPRLPNERKFLGWGVSDYDAANNEDSVMEPENETDLITLVGSGSVLENIDHVKLPLVDLSDSDRITGGYTYWIGDDGIKASYSTPTLNDNAWNKAGLLATAATSGVSGLQIDGYDDLNEGQISNSAVSRKTISLPLGQTDLPRELFHDVTPQSISLLTNTRLGGMKKDLSTAFELPLEEFNSITEFHAAGEQNNTDFYDELGDAYSDPRFYGANNSPNLGYLCEIPYDGGIVRGPSWDLMRNHYRLYKKEWESTPWERSVSGVPSTSFAARGSLPHSYSGKETRGAGDLPGDHFTYHISNGTLYSKGSFGSNARIRSLNEPRKSISEVLDPIPFDTFNRRTVARSPQITPIVTRFTMAIGLTRVDLASDWSLALSLDPYVTIVNPYNVPITFSSFGVFGTKYNPVRIKFEYTDKNNRKKTAGGIDLLSSNNYNQGSYNMILDPAGGPYTLEPGEVRVISPGAYTRTGREYRGISAIHGGFPYNEDSGYFVSKNSKIKPKNGTSLTVTLRGRVPTSPATTKVAAYLYHPRNHDGSARDVYTHLPPLRMFGDLDIFDQPLVSNIGASSTDGRTKGDLFFTKTLNTSQIPQPGESGLYICAVDLKMKTLNEGIPTLGLNPRGGAFDTRDWDGSERSSAQWDFDIARLDDISQLQLVADPSGSGYWGEGRSASDGGSKTTVLYEVPELPLSSLAQLQHLDTGVSGSSTSLAIGNSFPHMGLKDLTSIVGRRKTNYSGYSSVDSQVLADMSWAANDCLWDHYFFSGMNWGDAEAERLEASQQYETQQEAVDALIANDPTQASPLQNPRMQLLTTSLSDTQKEELKDYTKLSKYLAIYGGFNVNSTSQKAWKALFSSLREVDASYIDSGSKTNVTVTNAFSRFTIPVNPSGEVFGSYRELSDEDIENLATEMVAQVIARGPFMGLGDFVNRRLEIESVEGTDLASLGALQSAIESAGLNDVSMSIDTTFTGLENEDYKVNGNSKKLSTYMGTSGHLLQSDILNSVGSVLTARSDTFIVRSYGCTKDSSGNVIAEAWCEATVQRTPDWLIPTNEPVSRQRSEYPDSVGDAVIRQFEPNPDLPVINKQQGRRFVIEAFRWLNANEV